MVSVTIYLGLQSKSVLVQINHPFTQLGTVIAHEGQEYVTTKVVMSSDGDHIDVYTRDAVAPNYARSIGFESEQPGQEDTTPSHKRSKPRV